METHLETLCLGLRDQVDLEVVVANTGPARVHEVLDGVRLTRLGVPFSLGVAPVMAGLAPYLRAANADILHLHVPHPTAILSYLASRHPGRLIVTYHSDIVRQRVLGLAFRPFLHHALGRASAIVCTSPNYIESSPVLARHRDRCRVLPFSIAHERFETADADAVRRLRDEYGDRIVLGLGRLVSYKGFEFLIRAMPRIEGRLILIGNGPLRAPLMQLAATLGVEKKITFLDRVDDPVPFYHAADVFALPSVARSEAFGLVQLEAMAAGRPVVNTNIASGVPYVSPHEVTGLTVPPEDPRALADAITRLLDDPSLRARYGAAARRRVRESFSVGPMVAQTLALYEQVMGIPPGAGISSADPQRDDGAGGNERPRPTLSSTAPTRAERTS